MPTPASQHLRALPGGADLEHALSMAERAPAEEAEAAEAAEVADVTVSEPEAPTAEAPRSAGEPRRAVTASNSRRSAAAPMVGSPPSLAAGRYRLHPELKERLPLRQASWIAWSALTLAAASAAGLTVSAPVVAVALALGLGAWAAQPKRFLLGPLVTAAAVGAALLTGLLSQSVATPLVLAGSQVLAAGAVAGLGVTFMDGVSSDGWRRLQGTLGGAAGAGVGWWAATTIVGPVGESALTGALQGLALGLVGSQALLTSAMQWKSTDRVPKPGRIRATLAPAYREPCLRAWQLDRVFDKQAPDPDTRDGLGEVAAWVYRLNWTLMSIDREITALEGEGLAERRVGLLERAAASSDDFTRERLQATAHHLAQLSDHRDALALERGRTAAMCEYASAFLEEARAGLALARVQPGEHVPDRLGDVLSRLRTHAAAGDARRKTAREIGALS